jgi:hypothetical protein
VGPFFHGIFLIPDLMHIISRSFRYFQRQNHTYEC